MGEPFIINMQMIRKRLAAIGRNKSIGSDGVPGEILKLGREAMVLCIARLLDLINNVLFQVNGKEPQLTRGRSNGSHKLQTGQLNPSVCKQMERVTAGYLRQVWDTSKWLYEGQLGFRLGYSCERQIVTVCQNIADSLMREPR
jgi:hypothetical protein